MLPVDANIHLLQQAAGAQIEIHVAGAEAAPLRWRLELESDNGGGANQIVQSGLTDGLDTRPVASIRLNADARGHAVLRVTDRTGATVAERECRFSPGGGTAQC